MSFAARHAASAFAVALAAGLSAHALRAQTAMPAAPAVQHASGGIEWMSGGAGEEERQAMSARGTQLPFKVVLSGTGGQYVVAERLVLRAPEGDLLVMRDAGPIVMMRLPAGSYTLEATVQGKTEQRPVRIGGGPQTLEWRWPA